MSQPQFVIGDRVMLRSADGWERRRGKVVRRWRDAWGDWRYELSMSLATSTQHTRESVEEFQIERDA